MGVFSWKVAPAWGRGISILSFHAEPDGGETGGKRGWYGSDSVLRSLCMIRYGYLSCRRGGWGSRRDLIFGKGLGRGGGEGYGWE